MSDSDVDHSTEDHNAILGDVGPIGLMPWVIVQTGFPHSGRIGSHFVRENGSARLEITASTEGMPFGKVPRLILAHLTATFRRTQDRHVPLGRSQRAFLAHIGMATSGGPMRRLRDQARRLLKATIIAEDTRTHSWEATTIASRARLWWEDGPDQMWPNFLVLSESFAESCSTAVPFKTDT